MAYGIIKINNLEQRNEYIIVKFFEIILFIGEYL